jgi:hypothetical protein
MPRDNFQAQLESMKNNSKKISAILALSLLPLSLTIITAQTSFAASPASKSISGASAEKLLKAAYTKSKEYIKKSPYTIKTSQYNGGNSIKTVFYSADNKNSVTERDAFGTETIVIGDEHYTTEETGLNASDLAIAKDLGLNIKAKFRHMKVKEFQPPMSNKEWNETLRSAAISNFASSYSLSDAIKNDPKGKLTLKTQGKEQTITFTDSLLGNRDLWTINNGLLTSHIIYNYENKLEFKETLELKAATIKAPKGPFFELSALLADPKFKASQR